MLSWESDSHTTAGILALSLEATSEKPGVRAVLERPLSGSLPAYTPPKDPNSVLCTLVRGFTNA